MKEEKKKIEEIKDKEAEKLKEKNEGKEKNYLEMFSMLKEIKDQMKIMASDIFEMKKNYSAMKKKMDLGKKEKEEILILKMKMKTRMVIKKKIIKLINYFIIIY